MTGTATQTVTAICGTCHKAHKISKEEANTFGRDCECQSCLERAHVRFMRKTGQKLGLSCVKGCPCGFGK